MRALLVLLLLLTSCSRGTAPVSAHEATFPAGPPMADQIRFVYSVYLLPGHAQHNFQAEVSRLIGTRYKTLKLVDKIPEHPSDPVVSPYYITDVQKTYVPPTVQNLQYRGVGLSDQQKQALQKSHDAIILEFAHPKASVWTGLRTANSLIEDLARSNGGLILDEETRQVFTPDAWHKRRIDSWPAATDVPRISQQFTIDAYPNGEFHRQVTLGMAKMGMPDIVVQELPQAESDPVSNLIGSVAQMLAEGQAIPASGRFRLNLHSIKNSDFRENTPHWLKPNALSTACIFLKPGRKDEGDPDNSLIELSADLYSGPDSHARLENLLSSLFGWEESATKVQHTEALLNESKKERAKLPELRRDFLAGLAPGEYIELKAPFKTPSGGNEWMWIEVTRWRGKTITGTLDNDPAEVPDLKAGQVVEVSQDDVFDYIRRFSDGHSEGNTTGKILEKLEQGTEAPMRTRGEMPNCN